MTLKNIKNQEIIEYLNILFLKQTNFKILEISNNTLVKYHAKNQ